MHRLITAPIICGVPAPSGIMPGNVAADKILLLGDILQGFVFLQLAFIARCALLQVRTVIAVIDLQRGSFQITETVRRESNVVGNQHHRAVPILE